MYSATRNDVKQLARQIENLAKEVQSKLDSGSDFLTVANELVRNNNTFVFALGEVYALEQAGVKRNSQLNQSLRQYHNTRDSHGRFTSKK